MEIQLNNLKFFARHGLYAEEKQIGGEFEVNLTVSFTETKKITSLSDTIDYVMIHQCIRQKMEQPYSILESLVSDIADEILVLDNRVEKVFIHIKKLNPPIEYFSGTVSVSLTRERVVTNG